MSCKIEKKNENHIEHPELDFWSLKTTQCSALTSLVSTFAHETRETAHETSFSPLLTKRVSRNEFFVPAHETSAHETRSKLVSK